MIGRRPRARQVVLTGALAVICVAAAAGRAAAYVRYKTDSGMPFYWPQTCVPVTAYPNDLTDMTPDQTMHASSAAAATWSGGADQECTYLQVQVGNSSAPTPTARYDSRNSVIFRHDSWCKSSDPVGTCNYDPAALAITSVFVNTRDGKIRDGDIEVNAKYFVWTDLDIEPVAHGKQDLQNALTHEMGHLIGLDHTCYGTPTPPLDGSGNVATDSNGVLIPSCDKASDAVRATTMFASAMPGDVSKRTLAADDQQAVCDIYPKAQDPMVCPAASPSTDPGCACALARRGNGGGAGDGALLAGGGLAVALLGWRRRRRPGDER
jgi:hypothetical protein